MSVWKILACVGMLASAVLFALSMKVDGIFLLGPAVGAANFSLLAVIIDRLPEKSK